MEKVVEGKAKFYADVKEKISREMEVFYNPEMKLNRDISILLLSSRWLEKEIPHPIKIGLPMCGTGVRGIRISKEVKKSRIKKIFMNDLDETAFRTAEKNIELNKIKDIELSCREANVFLHENRGYDYIDIDPFGSPNKFIDSSLRRVSRKGILAVTATDTSAMTGTYPKVTKRKYWSRSLKTEHMHELGLRILIRKVQLIGTQYDKALVPVLSYYKDHYFRVFFQVLKGKKQCDDILSRHNYFIYCNKCSNFSVNKDIFSEKKCSCGSTLDYAGPLWTGFINNNSLLEEISTNKFLSVIKEESFIELPFFHDIHMICKKNKISYMPKVRDIQDSLSNKGYRSAKTHFSDKGIKTDAGLEEIVKVLRELEKK